MVIRGMSKAKKGVRNKNRVYSALIVYSSISNIGVGKSSC